MSLFKEKVTEFKYELILETLRAHNYQTYDTARALGLEYEKLRDYLKAMHKAGWETDKRHRYKPKKKVSEPVQTLSNQSKYCMSCGRRNLSGKQCTSCYPKR